MTRPDPFASAAGPPTDHAPVGSESVGSESDGPAYQLIDCGRGRKLEALGDYCIDRPCPAAAALQPMLADRWAGADAVFKRDVRSEGWQFRNPWPEQATIDCGSFQMPVRPTPFGHIGLFPEQAANWQWIDSLVRSVPEARVLNLFGYTGASSLAAAAAGARVAHVDAAKPNVEAARQAAEVSGLSESPIRYLIDDARKFASREVRRASVYDLVVLDPPAYGHGNRGLPWRLERDLWPLLEDCMRLIPRESGALLVSGHSAEIGASEIRQWLGRFRIPKLKFHSGRSGVKDRSGRFLDAGFYLRAVWGERG